MSKESMNNGPHSPGIYALWLSLWAPVVVITGACSSEPGPRAKAVEVIASSQWEHVARDEDPFVVKFPESVTECVATGIDVSEGLLDIDTDYCSFVTARTQLTDEIREGEKVQLTFWHLALVANEPAEGVMVLRVGDDDLFNLTFEIPRKEKVYYPTTQATRSYPAGTPVLLHIHNHGANTWKVYQLLSGG